jgi:hypothetical protein
MEEAQQEADVLRAVVLPMEKELVQLRMRLKVGFSALESRDGLVEAPPAHVLVTATCAPLLSAPHRRWKARLRREATRSGPNSRPRRCERIVLSILPTRCILHYP